MKNKKYGNTNPADIGKVLEGLEEATERLKIIKENAGTRNLDSVYWRLKRSNLELNEVYNQICKKPIKKCF